jgi:hypothetical protein
MRLPYWLLKILPMFDYVCPRCKREVNQFSSRCIHCGERYIKPLRVPPKCLKNKEALEAYVHKHVLPHVSPEQQAYLTQFFTILFEDNFERNDLTLWTGVDSDAFDPVIVTSPIKFGKYACECQIQNAPGSYSIAWKDLASSHITLYVRAYVRFSATPAVGEYLLIGPSLMSLGHNDVACAYLYNNGGTLEWCLEYADNGTYFGTVSGGTTPAILTNTWYCIAVRCTVSGAGNGIITMWVNGLQVAYLGGLTNNVGPGAEDFSLQALQIGAYSENGLAAYLYFDNVVLADTRIGCIIPPFHILRGRGGDKRLKTRAFYTKIARR